MATTKTAQNARARTTQATQATGANRGKPAPPAPGVRSKGVPAPAHPAAPDPGSGIAKTASPSDALKKQELLQKLTETTGLPKSRIRPVMEAMLSILGEAVAEERALQLPPLGKVKPLRSKEQDGVRISHIKVRQARAKSSTD